MITESGLLTNKARGARTGQPKFVPTETDPPSLIMLVLGDALELKFQFKASPPPKIKVELSLDSALVVVVLVTPSKRS